MNRTAALLLTLTVATAARADVVLQTNEAVLGLIRRHSTPPPIAARTLAMAHVAIFDAINSIDHRHQHFRVYVPDSPQASREAAALEAAYRVLMHVYPADRADLERELQENLEHLPSQTGRSEGVRLGKLVAERVIAWRAGDGSEASVRYTARNEPGRWRPTPPDYQAALLPQWARVTPFAIDSASQFRPADPPELNSERYARDLEEVQMVGAVNSPVRTDEETEIAHFWADGARTVTPPGHWNQIAQTVARQQRLSVVEQARLFALLNVALADAALVCWDMKYHCDLWRPVTAIREADTDGNDQTKPDPDWRPLLQTPPFPTCTSGHSTFSGAAAEMLALFFGRDDIRFTSISDATPRLRSFASFSQAAQEAGRSRIYGGIHFEFDNQAGLASGQALSQHIFRRHLLPLGGELAQAGLQRRAALRPTDRDGGTGQQSDASDLDDSGWRPARRRPQLQQTFRSPSPSDNMTSVGTSPQILYRSPTGGAAGATTVLSPVLPMAGPPVIAPAAAPSCSLAPAIEYHWRAPGIVGSDAASLLLPAY